MRFRRLQLRIQTTDGPYGVTLDFPDGLTVVWADNSMGKSTCMKSMIVALGMEAMLTTSQSDLPLPPAVKSRLTSGDQEYAIIESEVFVEIENREGARIAVQRTVVGARDRNLITVYEGPALTAPASAIHARDYFVSRQGAATREHGFHHFLAGFLGWSLPPVQTYDGNENPLYLQCVFPYLMVEQTRGWSTLQPPMPTHFRIRDVHKRAIEFILSLDAHTIALRRQELQAEKSRIESRWSAQLARAADLAERVGGTIQGLPQRPVAAWPPHVQPTLSIPVGKSWISIEDRVGQKRRELSQLDASEIPRVAEISESAQAELAEAEQKVLEQQTLLSRLILSLDMERQEVGRIEARLAAIDEDIQRNKDVRTLRRLGSRSGSAVDSGACPVCNQAIHDSLVPLALEQVVMSVDENIQFLSEQRHTFAIVHGNARKIVESRRHQVRAFREELTANRERVRVLRQTLVSDGRLPSIAALHTRIELESSTKRDQDTSEQFNRLLTDIAALSERWQSLQQQIAALPKDDVTQDDRNKISSWAASLRTQLSQYGFGSFNVTQATISPDTYRPEHEGFDLQTGISASDVIRTIWSYLCGMLEISRTLNTHHPGCVVFDEPRQQSTRDVSFAELLKRASTARRYGQQVIFFTSENRDRLQGHLAGLDHKFIPIDGRVLQRL